MVQLKDNEFLRQFQAEFNGEVAFIEYSVQERKIFLTKIFIPELADEVFRDEFIKSVLAEAESRRLKVVPTCSGIVSFFRQNREYKEMLPVGIRI
ncbi:MAG: N-acetyltransferase [Capnocytophaga sp.]|nr:N-acetyltransferase [Capnocytophaga sp.]